MRLFLLIPLSFFIFITPAISQDTIQKMVPNEILFKKSKTHNYSISPNGKLFIEVIDTNTESDLYVVDIENYKLLHKIPFGGKVIDRVFWLTNNRLLYESYGAINTIDIDGTNSMLVVDRQSEKLYTSWSNLFKNITYNKLINILPNEEHQILIETYDYNLYASVKQVNIFTGEDYTVMNGKKYKMNKWITDANGNVKLGIKYDNDILKYYKYDDENDKLEPFSIKIDGVYYPLKMDGNTYLNQNITFEAFGYDSDIIYITSNIGYDKRKLIKYNIEKEKVISIIAEDVNCDILDIDGLGIRFLFDQVGKKLAGIHYNGIMPKYKWYSEKYRLFHEKIKKKYPNLINEIIDRDATNENLLIYQWSDDQVGNIGVYNTKDDSYAVMFHFNNDLNNYKLSKTKSIIANTRDDYKLLCYLNLPPDYDDKEKLPLVVLPHGGPWARDYWGLDDFSQYFATRGYATLRVNFRGSTGFGKSHVLAGVNSIDEIMINDIADATSFSIENYNIDKEKVFIFGHSYGGYATYMSILKYPNIFASGVAVSAPTDIKDWLKMQKKAKNLFAIEYWNTALGTNESKYLKKISPINYTSEINKPLLIFHGNRDKTVPVLHAEIMAKELKKDKKNVKIEILKSEGHSISDSNTLGYLLDQSDKFFKSTVKKD